MKGEGVSPLKRWKNSMLFSFCRTQSGKMAGHHVAHDFSQVQFSLVKNVPCLSDSPSYIEIRVTVSNRENGPAVASFIHTGDAGGGAGGRARGLGRAVRRAPGLWHGAQAALTQSVVLKPKNTRSQEIRLFMQYNIQLSIHHRYCANSTGYRVSNKPDFKCEITSKRVQSYLVTQVDFYIRMFKFILMYTLIYFININLY